MLFILKKGTEMFILAMSLVLLLTAGCGSDLAGLDDNQAFDKIQTVEGRYETLIERTHTHISQSKKWKKSDYKITDVTLSGGEYYVRVSHREDYDLYPLRTGGKSVVLIFDSQKSVKKMLHSQ